MGFKIGSGTNKLSAWDKFKENKQKQSPGFDDEPTFDEGFPKGPKSSDLDDDWGGLAKPSPAPKPKPKPTSGKVPVPQTEAPGLKPKPTIGPVPLPGKPPRPTGLFDPAKGPKAKPGPGSFGGPVVPRNESELDSNNPSNLGFNGSGRPSFNPAFFEEVKGGQAIRIKDGVRASDAIKDLMGSKSGEYDGIASYAPVKAYKKYQAKFGAEADAMFDQKFTRMKIGIIQEPVDGPK